MNAIDTQNRTNIHATTIQIDGLGIAITGESGFGKTSLALGLLDYFSNRKSKANFVSDDRTDLFLKGLDVFASPPQNIEGKVEVHGFGISSIAFVKETKLSLVVEIVEQNLIDRLPEPAIKNFLGINLPTIKVPKQHENQSVRIISAWLDHN